MCDHTATIAKQDIVEQDMSSMVFSPHDFSLSKEEDHHTHDRGSPFTTDLATLSGCDPAGLVEQKAQADT